MSNAVEQRQSTIIIEQPTDVNFASDVFDPYNQRIFNYLYRLTKSKERAEDLTQEVFLRAYAGIGKTANLNLSPWLYRIASNLANDSFRRDKLIRFETIDTPTLPEVTSFSRYDQPEEYVILMEDQSEVRSALDRIYPHYKTALLGLVEGLSCKEIGSELGITEKATKSVLFRARAKLRDEIEKARKQNKDSTITKPSFPENEPITPNILNKQDPPKPQREFPEMKEPALIQGFEKMREVLNKKLLELVENSATQRANLIVPFETILLTERQVRETANDFQAISFFIKQLNALSSAGISLPDISTLLPKVKEHSQIIPENPDKSEKIDPPMRPDIAKKARKRKATNTKKRDTNKRQVKFDDKTDEISKISTLLNANTPKITDTEVIALTERAQKGDSEAFAGIYQKYFAPIYRYLLRMSKNQEDAMEIAQEVFIKAQTKISKTKDGTFVGPWLFRIAKNHFIDIQRTKKAPIDSLEEKKELVDAMNSQGTDSLRNSELRLDLFAVLNHLTSEQRAVLRLRFLEGLNHQETADLLGKSVDATKKLQARGLVAAKKMFKAEMIN